MLTIRLNGETHAVPSGIATVADLLAAQGIRKRLGVAVAVNGRVVPASEWDRHALASGDDVEIVKPIGGG
jgi:sulfur carrier protein